MNKHPLTLAVAVALLSGCASHKTFEDSPDPQLRVRASMPLCMQDCNITIENSEHTPPDPVPE